MICYVLGLRLPKFQLFYFWDFGWRIVELEQESSNWLHGGRGVYLIVQW